MPRAVITLALLLCLWGAEAQARCGPLHLKIKGETNTHSSKKILVTIAPDRNHSHPLVLLEGDKFEADVYYDPLKSHSRLFRDNCSETPKTVTVALLENGKEIDRRLLLFSRDFVADSDGGFVLRTKLRLGR